MGALQIGRRSMIVCAALVVAPTSTVFTPQELADKPVALDYGNGTAYAGLLMLEGAMPRDGHQHARRRHARGRASRRGDAGRVRGHGPPGAVDHGGREGGVPPRAMEPASGNLIFPMQSWLVRTRHHTILVDTCIGDHKKRQRPSWHMTTSGVFLTQLATRRRAPGCHRLCPVHASACGSCRLEHATARRTLGADVPQRHLRHSPQGMGVLGDGASRHAAGAPCR